MHICGISIDIFRDGCVYALATTLSMDVLSLHIKPRLGLTSNHPAQTPTIILGSGVVYPRKAPYELLSRAADAAIASDRISNDQNRTS